MSSVFKPFNLYKPLSEETKKLAERVKEIFGKDPNFTEPKDWQLQAWNELLAGEDIVVRAGTGSGKSLIFQGIALSKPHAICLVISPLISLMTDQVKSSYPNAY
jgi:superfamily II DNA helicase RecQ